MTRKNIPSVTVLMSCYNSEKWLGDAIESILAQTWRDFEFILVNDGSRDDTLEIIRRYAGQDKRIVIIDKKNTGLADSLNWGIRQARGKWIARLDADDLSDSHRLERQISFVSNHPDVILLGTGFEEINEFGRCIKVHRIFADHLSLVSRLERGRGFFPHSSAFYSTITVRQVGAYRSRIRRAEDLDLWLRLSAYGKLAIIAEPLVKIRKHAAQISHDDNGRRQNLDACAATVSYFLRQRGLVDPVDVADEEIANRFFTWVGQHMEKDGAFERRRAWELARSEYFSQSNRLEGLVRFMVRLIGSGHSMSLIKEKIVGSDLPARLAHRWQLNK